MPATTELAKRKTDTKRLPLRFASGWIVLVAGGFSAAGCFSDAPDRPDTDLRVEIDTIGDTVVVRTVSGSVWGTTALQPDLRIGAVDGEDHEIFGDIGAIAVDSLGEIYVYDRQVPALRKYARDGQYIGTLGREGGGPGEYAQPDAGLAVLADGRVVLRDPGNARLTVYTSSGAYGESWPVRGGSYTTRPLFAMRDGGFANPVSGRGQPTRLVRYDTQGQPLDTLTPPARSGQLAFVRAAVEGASMTYPVPFTSAAIWTWHLDGYFISAVTGRYAFDLLRPEGIVQLGRALEPAAVSEQERAAAEARITQIMRNLDPEWRWNGPAIPATKPFVDNVFVGEDGRIWVHLHQPGERTEPSDSDGSSDQLEFREPVVFDVFEPDGRYLGLVSTPSTFSIDPRPTFRGDYVWATERDELGVQYLVRYRLTHTSD